MSTMKIVLYLIFVIALLHASSVSGASDIVLKNQLQSYLNELDSKSDDVADATVVNILKLLNIHLQRDKHEFNVTSLDWYKTNDHPPLSPNQMRILIVISSFEGLYMHSGVGTFYAALSEFLASEGHSVTLLYTRMEDTESLMFTRWQQNYKKKGISITRLDESPVHIANSANVQKSYQVYSYLKQHEKDFDVVQFPDVGGAAYYSLVAKREGLAFQSKQFIVGLHGSISWMNRMESDSEAPSVDSLEQEFMERKSAEMADVLWSPSSEIVEWLAQNNGWILPEPSSGKFFLMPLLPLAAELPRTVIQPSKVREIVFFGKLQSRKGLELFCDALDKIASSRADLANLKITFLGKLSSIDGTPADEYLQTRAKSGWKFKMNMYSKDRKGALEYIRDPTRAVVISSIIDNAPYTVYECLYSGVSFVASNIPSIMAVIAPEDRAKTLFDANASALSAKIQQLVDTGIPPARPYYSLPEASEMWSSLYTSLPVGQTKAPAIAISTPLVSVCITHFNRPKLLEMALKSVEEQTYKNIEVVLVDDGSDKQDAIKYLDSLEQKFKTKGWKLLRTPNRYLGAARNHAVSNSNGEYIVFLDDDNYVRPEQVATYVRIAQITKADALTAIHDVFQGTDIPDEQTYIKHRSIPLGASAAVGLFKNCFGDANFFIKRSVFVSLGGFTEDRDVGQEDHEFLAKLVLAGRSLEVVPEPLLYYRMHDRQDQMLFNTDPKENQMRSLRSFTPALEGSYTVDDVFHATTRRRVTTRASSQTCNMTITSISPQLISTGTRPTITFRVSVLDCPIQTVLIGTYQCTNVVTQASPSGSSFTCTSPSITFPGTYSVTVDFTTGGVYRASQQILYVQNNQQSMTTSGGLGQVQYTPPGSKRTVSTSTCPFATQFDQIACNIEQISCATQGPLVELAACTYDSSTGYYSIKISFIGNGSPTSQSLIQLFEDNLNNSAWAAIGIKFITFSATGSCTPSGCICNPNYEGVDCSVQALCPGNCTSHGDCVDGTYSRVCQCAEGYTGADCSISACPNDCSGQGTCVVTMGNSVGVCACNPGYTGVSCANGTSSCPDACSGHGTCIGSTCVCASGYHGANCAFLYAAIEKQAPVESSSGETAGSKAALGGAIGGVGFLLIVALILGYVVWKRRRDARR